MKQEKIKYLFNSTTFLLAGIISIIRVEPIAIVISFLFFVIFILLGTLPKEDEQKILSEKI